MCDFTLKVISLLPKVAQGEGGRGLPGRPPPRAHMTTKWFSFYSRTGLLRSPRGPREGCGGQASTGLKAEPASRRALPGWLCNLLILEGNAGGVAGTRPSVAEVSVGDSPGGPGWYSPAGKRESPRSPPVLPD